MIQGLTLAAADPGAESAVMTTRWGARSPHARSGGLSRGAGRDRRAILPEEAEILRLEYRAVLLRAESDPDGGMCLARTAGRSDAASRHRGGAAQALLNLRHTETDRR